MYPCCRPSPPPEIDRYRNKVQFPVGRDKNGKPCIGFYAGRTHRIVPCPDCKLQPDWMNALAARACTLLEENGITAYNEETHTGRVRHLYHASGLAQRAAAFVLCGKRQRSAERGGNLRHTAKRVFLNDDFGQPQQ